MYGGTQGIPSNVVVNNFLPSYAYADFKHDFGGDKITANVLNDIETVGSRQKFFTQLQPLLGKSVYEYWKSDFTQSIPIAPDAKLAEYTEDSLLENVAKIPYSTVVGEGGKNVYETVNVNLPIAGVIPRNYTISRVIEKIKPSGEYTPTLNVPNTSPAGKYANLLSCLWAVSGSKGQRRKKFAIMYDAGNCATSEIGSLTNDPITSFVKDPISLFGESFDPNTQYEVYFINSSENLRDPAPKLVERTFKQSSKSPNVNVYFLNDFGQHTRYMMYSKKSESDQTANLYSRYTISTIRDNESERVRGTITYEDGKSRQLDDLKRESEIGSATTNAVSMFLEGSDKSKQMSCFFLKRSGDWCQALCLLDKERKYTISGTNKTTTLQQLEDQGVEIMLMTHDRVLLAYGLTLGLNVCFTNNRPSGHWIIYFKNADVFRIDDMDVLITKSNQLGSQLTSFINAVKVIRGNSEKALESINWVEIPSIVDARQHAYTLANLVDNEVLESQLDTLKGLLATVSQSKYTAIKGKTLEQIPMNDRQTAKELSDSLGKIRNLLPNIEATIQSVVDLIRIKEGGYDLIPYPQKSEEQITIAQNLLESVTSSRSFKASHKNSKGEEYNLEAAFTVIAERFIDDVESGGLAYPVFPNDSDISARYPTYSRTQISIVRSLFDIFKKAEVRTKTKGQTGGGDDTYYLPAAIYAITQTSIPIVDGTPDTFGFTVGQHMMNYDRWKYFVVDPYVVTKEDRGKLVGAIATFLNASQELQSEKTNKQYIAYLTFRLLVLYVDLAYNEWVLLSPANNPKSEHEEIDANEFVTPEEVALQLLRQRIEKLKEIFTALAENKNILPLLTSYETFVPEFQSGTPFPHENDLGKMYSFILNMVRNVPSFQFGYKLYEIEKQPIPEGSSNRFVLFLDPSTMVTTPYEIQSSDKLVGPTLQIPSKPGGFEFFQNIITNVYVPLIPQPNVQAQQQALAEFQQNTMETIEGGSHLQNRRPLYTNAKSLSSFFHEPRKHERLRKRSRTRTTPRLRKSSRKSKTRRQRNNLDTL